LINYNTGIKLRESSFLNVHQFRIGPILVSTTKYIVRCSDGDWHYFLNTKLWCFLSRLISFNIFINVLHSFEKTPKALRDRLIVLKWSFCCVITSLYRSLLRSTLFWRLNSYPTESSSMYKQSIEIERSRSGR
jgi:hypothetical protein